MPVNLRTAARNFDGRKLVLGRSRHATSGVELALCRYCIGVLRNSTQVYYTISPAKQEEQKRKWGRNSGQAWVMQCRPGAHDKSGADDSAGINACAVGTLLPIIVRVIGGTDRKRLLSCADQRASPGDSTGLGRGAGVGCACLRGLRGRVGAGLPSGITSLPSRYMVGSA